MVLYNFENGLDIRREIMRPNDHATRFHIEGSDFEPLPIGSPALKLVENSLLTPIPITEDSRTLTAIEVEQPQATSKVLFGMAWGSDVEHPIGTLMTAAVVSKLPKADVITWNAFGHGAKHRSSRINHAALQYASRTGVFGPIGKEYAERLKPFLGSNEPIDLIGASEGGRVVLAMVPFLGRKIRSVVLLDPPGTLDVSYTQLIRQFRREDPHSREYIAASRDTTSRELIQQYEAQRVRHFIDDARHGIVLDHYWHSPRAMAKNGLGADINEAARHITGRLAFILPRSTELNNPDEVRAALETVATRNPALRAELWSFDGSHAVINAGPSAQAALLTAVLKHTR